MPSIVNVADFIKIGLIALITIYGFNKAMQIAGIDFRI